MATMSARNAIWAALSGEAMSTLCSSGIPAKTRIPGICVGPAPAPAPVTVSMASSAYERRN